MRDQALFCLEALDPEEISNYPKGAIATSIFRKQGTSPGLT